MRLAPIALALLTLAAIPPAADKITKETFKSGDRTRSYYLYVPEALGDTPAPLLVLLHGSGRNGLSLADRWKDLAKKERVVLAGPDAVDSGGWNMGPDGPDFLHDLVEELKARRPIDPRRVYLFGHSAGAIHGLMMAILESEYFAAGAFHAGALPPDAQPFVGRAPRKIPMAVWVGTNDPFFPLPAVRATRDLLVAGGFPATLTEIKGHTHDYYGRAAELNRQAWTFLSGQRLDSEPVFQPYQLIR